MHELITSGFFYPNDLHAHWSIMIVLYPYITGLVAGAFIVSSLYHVFGVRELKPVARFSLVAAFAFLMFACTPLLCHLGHPERAFNLMFTPKFTSAMSGFGYIYYFYMLLVLLEIWFVYRPEIIQRARVTKGPLKALYWCLALGSLNDNDTALALDHKIIGVLAAIGIPSACLLHGYVGFLFGSLKSNPWWSSPLMPVIFLLSAIVSGISILIVCYWLVCKFSNHTLDAKCIKSMFTYLWAFFILDVAMEGLELLTHLYEGHEEWHIVSRMLSQRLGFSFYVLQIGICSIIPLIVLSFVVLKKMRDSISIRLGLTCAFLILVQVLAMRWNVIIGGQLFSKSLRGLTSYTPTILGREGLLLALILFMLPFVVMYVFNLILPLFEREPAAEKQ